MDVPDPVLRDDLHLVELRRPSALGPGIQQPVARPAELRRRLLAVLLLRGGVGRGPREAPAGTAGARRGGRAVREDFARDAEVGEYGASGGVEEDVGGLDVAVDEWRAPLVRVREGLDDVDPDARHGRLWDGLAALQEVAERQGGRAFVPSGAVAWIRAAEDFVAEMRHLAAREQADPHGEVGQPGGRIGAGVIDGQYRGMFAGGEEAGLGGLAAETSERHAGIAESKAWADLAGVEYLERDLAAARAEVVGEIDAPHPSLAEKSDDFIDAREADSSFHGTDGLHASICLIVFVRCHSIGVSNAVRFF